MQPAQDLRSITTALIACVLWTTVASDTAPASEVIDLTGQVVTQATLRSRDNFTSELRYEVTARNLTGHEFLAESLVIVLDGLTNVAGQALDPLTQRPLLSQVEVVSPDGTTPEGKPYFRVPLGQEAFGPHAQTPPVTVRLRNPSFITGLTPSFKVFGQRKEPAPPKRTAVDRAPPAPPSAPPAQTQAFDERQMDALVDLLIRKGLLTEDEWRDAVSAPPPRAQ